MKLMPEVEFIAEVSANHLGSFQRAKDLVQAAADSGATSVKFQTYTADTMTLNLPQFAVSDEHALWGGKNLYSLYKEAYTPWEWHSELFSYARSLGIIPFSSPFDLTAVEFLEGLNVSKYKIASLETGDHRLIRAVAETGKPLIVSTGATEWSEINDLVAVVKSTGNRDLTLLVCTSSYPALPKDAHVNRLSALASEFGCKVGLSDHTLGLGVSIAAIAKGASVIEKHLTLKRSDGGADAAFSMEPSEFAQLVKEGISASESLGRAEWSTQASEQESRRLRRSLYVVVDVAEGELVGHENVRAIRPGGGCQPRYLDEMVGKKFKQIVKAGTPMNFELLE
jgi:pseudaminic acid synthase